MIKKLKKRIKKIEKVIDVIIEFDDYESDSSMIIKELKNSKVAWSINYMGIDDISILVISTVVNGKIFALPFIMKSDLKTDFIISLNNLIKALEFEIEILEF